MDNRARRQPAFVSPPTIRCGGFLFVESPTSEEYNPMYSYNGRPVVGSTAWAAERIRNIL